MGLGFVGAGMASGGQAALDEILEQRLAAQIRAEQARQQELENALSQRAADRGDAQVKLGQDRLAFEQEVSNRPEPVKPVTMSPGGALVDPSSGRIIASVPDRPEKPMGPQVLSAGAQLVDPSTGRIIASAPRAPEKPERSMDDVLKEYEAKKQIDAKYTGARPSLGAERQTLAYYTRAKQASDDIAPLEESIAGQGLMGQLQGQFAPNLLQTEQQQLYRQAQRAFTEARLRKESGAAIPTAEYENDARTYFAQPGDAPAVIEQKRRARQVVLEGLKTSSGRAYQEHFGESEPAPAAQEFDYVPGKGLVPRTR